MSSNTAAILEIGGGVPRGNDLRASVSAIKAKPAEHFHSREELLAFSRSFLTRANDLTRARVVREMPKQTVVVKPLPEFEEKAGVGSRFQQEPDPAKPAVFLINLSDWQRETRADAEITTVHETLPGHYLQKALARELRTPTRLAQLVENDAYTEGWARYAESLGEEDRIYDTLDASVMRRLWPARGMVLDPGLHAFHWSRQQAIEYMVSSGHLSAEAANDYVDRIAVMPGQLTAYDSGAMVTRLYERKRRRNSETSSTSESSIRLCLKRVSFL